MIESLALSVAISASDGRLRERGVRLSVSGSVGVAQTPLPEGMLPSALMEGMITSPRSPTADLVRAAKRHVDGIATLPINPDDEQLVDSLVDARTRPGRDARVVYSRRK
jgi:hypothetical protein